MTHFLRSSTGQEVGSLLPVAEFLHRISNDYARTIAFASNLAVKSGNWETKAALREITQYLYSTAETHRMLSPPEGKHIHEFTENLAQLCCAAIASFDLNQRGIELLLTVDGPVWLEIGRSWRARLIIFELIDNVCRHAFEDRTGHISVGVATVFGWIVCRVSDDGSSTAAFEPGRGTHLVDALAVELNGSVKRRFSDRGTTVTLSFPIDSPGVLSPTTETPPSSA
jgi:two-component sensor histidine kinase